MNSEEIEVRLLNVEARSIAYLARLKVVESLVVKNREQHEGEVEFVLNNMIGVVADSNPAYASALRRSLET